MTVATEYFAPRRRRTSDVIDVGPQEYSFDEINQLCDFCMREINATKQKYSKLAEKAGVCPTTISNLAKGNTNFPRASTVLQVLRALGFEVIVRG